MEDNDDTRRALNRRSFIHLTGAAVTTALLGCDGRGPKDAQRLLRWAEGRNEGLERALFRHTSIDQAPRNAKLAGAALPSYYVSKTLPVWDASVRGPWSLEVTGLVRRPLKLSLDDLLKLKQTRQRVNHYCVEGWTAVVNWWGVRVSELARRAEVMPGADYVDFQSFDDGYHESWDIDSALHRQTLIAYALDGQLLSPAHGAPARLHSPIKLGYKSTKFLTRVVFMPERNGGYWSDQGYEWYAGT
ncbi:MAG TPA: molybdopterin-dependent oxidoreductase [Gemmatimonadaceae bacterium]|nr:molybdopterin-dependent oxidoreductase [Gemmatimonadaceae bacterium]